MIILLPAMKKRGLSLRIAVVITEMSLCMKELRDNGSFPDCRT